MIAVPTGILVLAVLIRWLARPQRARFAFRVDRAHLNLLRARVNPHQGIAVLGVRSTSIVFGVITRQRLAVRSELKRFSGLDKSICNADRERSASNVIASAGHKEQAAKPDQRNGAQRAHLTEITEVSTHNSPP